MNAQLFLLLALVAPFCTFTHASPTVVPTDQDVGISETTAHITLDSTESPKDLTVITGPPATDPAAAPKEAVTEKVTEVAALSSTVKTEESTSETEAPAPFATTAPASLITDPPAVETIAPTKAAEEVQTTTTEIAKTKPSDDVVIEEGKDEGLSSGQVAGIVIAALLAVVIVIAVVIAVVRRMGKYSP